MSSVFWAIFILPWILDLVGTQGVMLTLFASLLWGAALGASLLGGSSKDPLFRKRCYFLVGLLLLTWLFYYFYALIYPAANLSTAHRPFLIKIFIFFHAGLLSSALGLMAVLFLTSLAWLIHEYSLRKPSWERRNRSLRLPSLESLSRASKNALQLAFRVWGMGLFLAAITTYLQSRQLASENNPALYTWQWASDPRVLFTAVLWGLLYLGVKIEGLFAQKMRWRFNAYLLFSLFFIILFIAFMGSKETFIHEPVEWFLR